MSTSCDTNTRSVIIECAYFNPEDVIGKSVKYDLKSEAAHKFERGVDPLCHENILRRFLYIVEQHATIKNVALFQNNFKDYVSTKISFDIERVNNILGTSLKFDEFHRILHGLGFSINNDEIKVPSYRSDIKIENDIADRQAKFDLEAIKQENENRRKAEDLAARERMNESDNETAKLLAAAEMATGEKVQVSTGTGIDPDPQP